MIRLLLKIFIAYWIVAGIVIVISDFEPHRHIHHPELTDALDSSLALNGQTLAAAYEGGRCGELQKLLSDSRDGLYLATMDGRVVCGNAGIPDLPKVVAAAVKQKKRITANFAWFQLLATPITSPSGATYVLLLKSNYSSALGFHGMLPGYTTVCISFAVTVFLGLLIVLPLRRLRQAAGQIAAGRLDARVRWWSSSTGSAGARGGDDIDQLIRDFNHMAERLESLAKAQRILLRDVSHELRSPLNRLGVGLGLARAQAPVSMHETLDRIESEAARLNMLIGQILSLSRLDVIQRIDAPCHISLSKLVADLLPDIQYEAAQNGCMIGTTTEAGCDVTGDEELLRAAVENVLRNAIKYASGSGLIQVETATEIRHGRKFSRISISDNGPGIPEHELEFVREPFYRADRSRHWEQEGFGIGLAIADRAARLHRGILGIRNKPDGGLMVEIWLPSVGELPEVTREITVARAASF
jgi:two-component system sensor histidine kinase CpxA